MSEQAKRRQRAARKATGLPTVAIVGRPNVGKSTLLNRIVGRREAIVEERPGVTRDRKDVDAEWCGTPFVVIDTGGWLATGTELDKKVSAQSERAIDEADVVLLVVDTTVGITEEDERVAEILRQRRSKGSVIVVANKTDGSNREPDMWAFSALGLGDPWPVSALHGRGTGDMLDAVIACLPAPELAPDDEFDFERASEEVDLNANIGVGGGVVPAVVIVGRPNVGKSTLFNRLIGDDRSVVHDMPGTTRDTIDTLVSTESGEIRFMDTAGMRRKSKVDDGTEYFSLVRALKAIDEADAAILVIDATEGITHQDQRLAERVDAAGCPVVILLNKWELLDADARAAVARQVEDRLAYLSYAPIMKGSAKTGAGVQKLLPELDDAIRSYHVRVPTRALNELLSEAQAAHPNREARILYATQGATDPPTFTLFANRPLSPQYMRYLERRIREHFHFGATPLKLRVRKRGD